MSKSKSLTMQTASLFWSHIWRYPRYTLPLFFAIPLQSLATDIVPPLIVATILNRLASGNFLPHQVWQSFGWLLVAYSILIVTGSLSRRLTDACAWRLEAKVTRNLARQIYDHLLTQSASFHANRFSGSLVSQTNKIISGYVRTADTTIFNTLPLLWGLLFSALILARRAPLFVVLLIGFAIIYIWSAIFITRPVRQMGAEHAAEETKQTGYLADSVTNVMAVKSYAGSQFERDEFHKITQHTHNSLLRLARAFQRQNSYFSILATLIQALAIIAGVVSVVSFGANIATVFLVITYTATTADRLFNFSSSALRNYSRSFGDANDMTAMLALQPEVKDPIHPEKLRIKKGAVRLEDVAFTHEGTASALFHDLNIDVEAGEKIGLVGHSGSGKSTLTRILLRFSDIDSGRITIDGQDITAITQDDLHRVIAYVPQEPIMFHRSLAENISYGDFKATQAQIIRAAKLAHADEFIRELPQGYDTLVGERGVKLSGGQRQRIAIARALLKNAPILLLDEATSALDSESEVLIQDALWKLMEGRTALVIAHRLSTIQKMDRIIVLDQGKIAEIGKHSELLKANGIYAKLWAHQSGGFIEE